MRPRTRSASSYCFGLARNDAEDIPQLRDALRKVLGSEAKEVDVLKWTGRTALELLGQGALGYSFDPLVEDVTDPFAEAVKSFL